MFDNFNIGQYIEGDSYLHKLDPRSKILALIVIIVCIIMMRSWQAIILLTLFCLFMFSVAKLSWRDLWNSLKPLIPLLIIAFLFNLFVTGPGDSLILTLAFLKISRESLINAILMNLRIASLIVLSNLFISLTTAAMQLSDGLSDLLSPLARLGVPVQDIGMMMSIALRFIPTLMEETDQIMKAQSSRGANYDTGGFLSRIKGLITIMIPLFVTSFRKAETLAEAMEARAYRSDIKRGKLHPLKMEKADYLFLALIFILFPLLVLGDYALR